MHTHTRLSPDSTYLVRPFSFPVYQRIEAYWILGASAFAGGAANHLTTSAFPAFGFFPFLCFYSPAAVRCPKIRLIAVAVLAGELSFLGDGEKREFLDELNGWVG